jgi:drug/metabolite transporter (DMT)-like permease
MFLISAVSENLTHSRREARIALYMLSDLSTHKKGEMFILLATLLWALFPSITALSLVSVPPMLLAGLSMLAACILFALILTVRREWTTLREGRAMKDILIGTGLNGILFYGIIFFAMKHTTAGNAVIVFQMEVLFAFLILSFLIKHEPFYFRHFIGALLMIFGAVIILLPHADGIWKSGDALILLATAIAPIGNFFQQRARQEVSSEHVLLIRSLLAGLFFIILSLYIGDLPSMETIWKALPIIFVNGFLLLGLTKIFWFEGFIRIPITKANSLATVGPFFGLIFAYLILGDIPDIVQIIAVVPIGLGMLILMRRE